MQDHTAPGRRKTIAEQLGTDESPDDADAPHTGNVADERKHGFAHALQHTFDDDGDAVERLRDSNHTKYGSTEQDDFRIFAEDADHIRCEQEEKTTRQYHEGDFYSK